MGLFVFNIFHMYLAGAAGYGIYTTLFSHFMNDDIMRYSQQLTLTHINPSQLDFGAFMAAYVKSMMNVAIKQVYGIIIWISGLTPRHPRRTHQCSQSTLVGCLRHRIPQPPCAKQIVTIVSKCTLYSPSPDPL